MNHSMHSEKPCPACGDLDGCHLPNQSLRASREPRPGEIDAHFAAACAESLNGGPAFPPHWDPRTHASGMTLRDYFAAKAMQAWLTLGGDDVPSVATVKASLGLSPDTKFDWEIHYSEFVARNAYIAADQMLAARTPAEAQP